MQRLFEDMPRRYLGTHPWITFTIDLGELTAVDWLLLGEAASKCSHLAGVPLKPEIARTLNSIYLSKGVHGTTAIEGNTLSEEEVLSIVEGRLDLPPSRDYLEQEVRNIVDACNQIINEVVEGGPRDLTPERLCRFNGLALRGLELPDDVVPGRIRTDEVGVRRYLGAPAEDLEYLLDRFCNWLNGPDFRADADEPFAFAKVFAKAVAAHLYLAWIHPFGDGNGRTARLVEFQVLVESGVPIPTAHLLSDHYNKTRSRYYEVLDRASKIPPFSLTELFRYALQGFVDELKAQLGVLRQQQHGVTWENYVHERFRDMDTPTSRRQRHILLDLPKDEFTARSKLPQISPRVAEGYAGKSKKTITRDLNRLAQMGLIVRDAHGGIRPEHEIVLAFLPLRADGPVGGASR